MKHAWIWLAVALTGCVVDATGAIGLGSTSDADGDGDPDGTDCAPLDPTIHHGAPEACNEVDDDCDYVVDEPTGGSYCVPLRDAPTWADQCLDHVQVGRLAAPGSGCPAPGGAWTVRSLFAAVTGRGGAGYCVYEHPDPREADVSLLPPDAGRPASDWLAPDCLAVAPLTPPTLAEQVSAAVWEDYFDGWLEQSEWEPRLPSSGVGGASLPARAAHVAVLDSAPPNGGFASPAASTRGSMSRHGAAMGLLVQHLACPEGRAGGHCVADFSNHVALASTPSGGSRRSEGGAIGMFHQVAEAVDEAVGVHRARYPAQPFVLVLSIGADAFYQAAHTGDRPAADALIDALEDAVCAEDAIVFAASGNETGGPHPASGPMIPAAWTSRTTRCGRPLVVPVGGVDPLDRDIRKQRDGARPELVAPARSVALDLANGAGSPEPSALMTGTSFGPVAAAAATAVLAAYAPHLSRDDLVDALYDASTPLGRGAAEFCATTSCRVTRRLSICGALLHARDLACDLAATEPLCGQTFACESRRVAAGAGAAVVPSPIPGPGVVGDASILTDVVSSPFCTGTIHAYAPALPDHPDLCPFDQYGTSHGGPGFGPQPDPVGCRVCALDPSAGELVMALSEKFTGGTLHPPTLVTSEGDKIYLGNVISGPLSLGEEYEIDNLDVDESSDWAVLYFTVKNDDGESWSQMEEIEVW